MSGGHRGAVTRAPDWALLAAVVAAAFAVAAARLRGGGRSNLRFRFLTTLVFTWANSRHHPYENMTPFHPHALVPVVTSLL